MTTSYSNGDVQNILCFWSNKSPTKNFMCIHGWRHTSTRIDFDPTMPMMKLGIKKSAQPPRGIEREKFNVGWMVFHFILVPLLTKVTSNIQTILTYLPTLYPPSALPTHMKTSMISSSVIEGTLKAPLTTYTTYVSYFTHSHNHIGSVRWK